MAYTAHYAWSKGIYSALVKLIHLISSVQFSFAVYYDFLHVNVPQDILRGNVDYGGKFKYLTFLTAIVQAFYFSIALLNDFFGTNEVSPKKLPFIRKVKDYIFATFAFPLAIFVGATFWGLYAIDRELVFPKALDAFFPGWLNHVMHTNIVVFIILELFTSFRKYPKRKAGLVGLSVFMLAYLVWIHIIKHNAGIWVYPVLEVLNLPQRVIFFVVQILFAIGLYVVGEFVNEQIWTREIKQAAKLASRKTK